MERFHPSTSKPKVERRIIEKNRRNHLKNLYAKLYSLLPSGSSKSKEVLPVPDQIDEATNYIKSLENMLQKYKEKKGKLLHEQRSHSFTTTQTIKSSKITNVEVHEMGPNMHVILISGMEEQGSFYGIIRLLHEYGFEVVNANFSSQGNSTLQVVHENGGNLTPRNDNTAVASRLKELIYGYSRGEAESTLDLLDFEIEPDILASGILELMTAEDFCFLQQL